jgi:uncharacterized repeat protein (TIGR03803 family)
MNYIFSALYFRRWPHLILALSFLIHLSLAHAAPIFESVYGFEISPTKPTAALIKGSDGNFYGTTTEGGSYADQYGVGNGTVFRLKPDGSLTTLVSFNTTNGRHPQAALVQGTDGDFYGTTAKGGSHSSGTVFKMTASGTLTTLVNFTFTNGSQPTSALVQGRDGNFYGTTKEGGSNGSGTVFRVTPDGVLTTLVNFSISIGSLPESALTLGSDGNFYGTTAMGGNFNFGTVFKMYHSGKFRTLVHFNGTNGAKPISALVLGDAGDFYGTTSVGGNFGDTILNGYGTAFRMTPTGILTTLVNFTHANGSYPAGPLVRGGDGNLYGTTLRGGSYSNRFGNTFGTVFKMTPGGTLTTLVNFNLANGGFPSAALLDGGDGSYYGTTMTGGSSRDFGSVFKMTSSGSLTTLVNFKASTASYPHALLQAGDGNLYGTTYHGGIESDSNGSSYGTAFKLTLNGTLNTLANFSSTSGAYPAAGLVQDDAGNFFGITKGGGNSQEGTVFKMTPEGQVTTMAHFNRTNGRNPNSRLLRGNDGNFYGTTSGGGSADRGTVFQMTPLGILTTIVNFASANGSYPNELMQGADGNFYGTTSGGGSGQSGTVFMVTPQGIMTTLVNFTGQNGSYPSTALVQGSDGNFYGRTSGGGVNDRGTVFRMTPPGDLTTLANLTSENGSASGAFIEGSDGNFYGTSKDGGRYGFGTVFKMTPSGVFTTIMDFTGENGRYPASALIRGIDGNLYGTTEAGGTTADGRPAEGGQIYRLRMGPTVLSLVTNSSVTLNGMVNPGGYPTTVAFQYGKDPALGIFSTVSAGILQGNAMDTPVHALVSGLQPGSVYYFRVVASNAENTVLQLGSIFSFTTSGSQGPYSTWAATRFSSTQLSNPLISGAGADPDKDGVVNLLEYAFDTNPLISRNTILTAGTGTSGLPLIQRTQSPSTLSIQYIRRKTSAAPGLNYIPQFSSSLVGAWEDFNGQETVQSIDAVWERVTVEKSASSTQQLFGRMKVFYEE